jgi:hypothetical protein
MVNTLLSILILILMGIWASVTFILANVEKEDCNMTTVIEVKPNKDGKYIVVLYGNTIELVPVKPTVTKKTEK